MKKIIVILIILGALGFGINHAISMKQMKSQQMQQMSKMPPPVVKLETIKEQNIIEVKEYVGRVKTQDKVDIRARVKGYLDKRYFKEGQIIKKGDLLYRIEQKEYIAAVERAEADILKEKAALEELKKNLTRAEELIKNDYISKSKYDNSLAAVQKSQASIKAKIARLRQAEINLGYTEIYSPINGKIGSVNITLGNYVGPQSGALASIVKFNPVNVSFNVPAIDYTKYKLTGKKHKKNNNLKVGLKFSDGTKFDTKGILNFSDNQIDETTGTIKLRAEFKNSANLLIPGQYVNVLLYNNIPTLKVVVQQALVLEDGVGKYVYTLGKNNIVEIKRIKIEGEHETYWIVKEGLKAGDKIIGSGLLKIRPQMPVMLASQMPKMPMKKKEAANVQ